MKSNVDLVAVDGVSSDNFENVHRYLSIGQCDDCMGYSVVHCSIIYIVISIQNLVVVSCVKFTTMSLAVVLRCCRYYTGAAVADAIVICCYEETFIKMENIYISLHGNAISKFWLAILQF